MSPKQISMLAAGVSGGWLIRHRFTAPGEDPFAAVDWGFRVVTLRDPDGWAAVAADEVEAPVSWSGTAVATVATVARRYLGRLPDGTPERSVRALVERVVNTIGGWAQASGHTPSDGERAVLEAELAALVLTQRAAFATPVWLNVGLEQHPFTSACFILETDDSIRALLDWNAREGLIFQQGGGAGVNLSKVRSSREPVSRGGLASGPVSFMRAADAWAATIRSGGRARRGAKMVVLDADHPAAAYQVWEQALSEGAAHGLRNAQTTLIPPTGTVSLMLDCESTGIEPYYALAGRKRFADGGEMHFASRAIADGLLKLGYSTHALEELGEYAIDHGHLTGAPALRGGDAAVVQTASGPDPVPVSGHLGMVAAVQPLLSGGVSKTLNLPAETTPETIESVFLDAWRKGLKSIAVYRQGSKIVQPLHAREDR
jgi:ribonucleotide reductase alpha subunit